MVTPIGTSMFAPQARVIDMASGNVVGLLSGQAVAGDLVSVTITLKSNDVAHLDFTLNNQRFDPANPTHGMPIFPPWKYNNFEPAAKRNDGVTSVSFGQLVRVDMRYGEGNWVKMMIAQITDLKFAFPASGTAQVTVTGEDLLSLLKVKPKDDLPPFEGRQEENIVQAIVIAAYPSSQNRPQYDPSSTATARTQENRTQPLTNWRFDKNRTYLQTLHDLADRMDYEIYVSFNQLEVSSTAGAGPIQASSELTFGFAPARSKTKPPDTAQSAWDTSSSGDNFHYVLKWGASLIDFSPQVKLFEIPTGADASGTQPGKRARSKQPLTDSDLTAFFTAELPTPPSYPDCTYSNKKILDAVSARTSYLDAVGVDTDNNESSPGTNLDASRLKLQALSKFATRVRQFMTAEATVIGLPKLRPGAYVEIVGLRPPFDGYYYITQTAHTLDGSGYRTKLSLRRPGMIDPHLYLSPPGGATPS